MWREIMYTASVSKLKNFIIKILSSHLVLIFIYEYLKIFKARNFYSFNCFLIHINLLKQSTY